MGRGIFYPTSCLDFRAFVARHSAPRFPGRGISPPPNMIAPIFSSGTAPALWMNERLYRHKPIALKHTYKHTRTQTRICVYRKMAISDAFPLEAASGSSRAWLSRNAPAWKFNNPAIPRERILLHPSTKLQKNLAIHARFIAISTPGNIYCCSVSK